MCNSTFTIGQVAKQSNDWNNAVNFGRHSYLLNIRTLDCKHQTYYVKTTGTLVKNRGFTYLAKSKRLDSTMFSWIGDLFNGNFKKYREMKKRFKNASCTVDEMLAYNRQLRRVSDAYNEKRKIVITAKQAKLFSDTLKLRLHNRGHKIRGFKVAS